MRDRWFSLSALRRLPWLLLGLVVFGAGIAVMAQAGLGLGPWEAFHQGVARITRQELGTISILVGIPVLAAWWPLGERPGIGTICNVVVIGLVTNAFLALLPAPRDLPLQVAMMLGGVCLIALASGIYLSADLGPGPRDGLMTGLHRRFGWSIRRSRTLIELTVLACGFVLGGTVGLGTIVFAFAIGPGIQVFLGVFDPTGRVTLQRRAELGPEPAIVGFEAE